MPPLPITLCRAIAQSEAHVRGLTALVEQRRAQGWCTAELEAWLRAAREHLDELREMRTRLLGADKGVSLSGSH